MDAFLYLIGFGILMFLMYSLPNIVDSIKDGKVAAAEANRKAAEANRDAKLFELESLRIREALHNSEPTIINE